MSYLCVILLEEIKEVFNQLVKVSERSHGSFKRGAIIYNRFKFINFKKI